VGSNQWLAAKPGMDPLMIPRTTGRCVRSGVPDWLLCPDWLL